MLRKANSTCARADGSLVPVHVSLNRFRGYQGHALGMVVTDLSEQKRKQAAEIKQTETMRRLLLERAFSAQEEERQRIARELHDEAGQLLTSLLVGLRTLEDSRNMAAAKAQGHRLREITAQAIDEIGRLARGLHPGVLYDHGLGVALSRYVTEYSKTHKIAVDLALDGFDASDLRLASAHVVPHSPGGTDQRSEACGSQDSQHLFECSATALKVAVSDDGRGFNTKGLSSVSSNRLGIQGMRQRAGMLGGTVSFISQGTGTRILLEIPLDQPVDQPFVRQGQSKCPRENPRSES